MEVKKARSDQVIVGKRYGGRTKEDTRPLRAMWLLWVMTIDAMVWRNE